MDCRRPRAGGERDPRKRDRLRGGEQVEIRVPSAPATTALAENIPLTVVYEDADLLVINKPPGLVVHPGAGNREGTLLNALLHHLPPLAALPRAGIVHRLDKDTSGLLVVAKTELARQHLIAQLAARTVEREYVALIEGVLIAGGTVEAPIGRHRHDRTRMAVSSRGKQAVSHYRVLKNTAHTRWRRSSSNPGARTRSACTWRICTIRLSATRCTAAGCGCRRAVVRCWPNNCGVSSARRCTRSSFRWYIP